MGAVFFFLESRLTVESEDLALDWSNTLFVVGVSLAVVVVALFLYPKITGALSKTPATHKE